MPHEQVSDTCRSCGQPIQWAITVKGKRMPIDPEPVPGGNLKLTTQTISILGGVEIAKIYAHVTAPHPALRAHVSHFKTCPQADANRKRKAR